MRCYLSRHRICGPNSNSSSILTCRCSWCQQSSRENRLHLIIRGSADLFTNHSNKSRSQTALSVASGGADGPSNLERFLAFTSKNFFLLGMVAAVSLARAFPHVSTCMLKKRSVISMSTYQHHCILIRSLITLLFGHINVPS